MVYYDSHWQFLQVQQFSPELQPYRIFDIWKANELRHAQIGRITMKPKA